MAKNDIKKLNYGQFQGVDWFNEPGNVSEMRSPDMVNMISDQNRMLVKRLGYEDVWTFSGQINGVFQLVDATGRTLVIHEGTRSHLWKGGVMYDHGTGLKNARSVGFQMGAFLYILDGAKYWSTVGAPYGPPTEVVGRPPTVVINRDPQGGGVPYEEINLLSDWRKDSFISNGTATVYQLSTTGLSSQAVSALITLTDGSLNMVNEGSGLTVNRTNGRVTFSTAPQNPPEAGVDNVVITYGKHVVGNADRIKKCNIYAIYGAGATDRVFVSGNPDYPNYDWYSGSNDPTFFGDLSYSIVGQANSAIMGYQKIGSDLAVIKEDDKQDATIYLRRGTTMEEEVGKDLTVTKAVFTIAQGVASVGAVCKGCFQTLDNDHLFLSRQGLYGLVTNAVTAEKNAERRSLFINRRLVNENLAEMVGIEHNGYYYLSNGNGSVYVADSRQRSRSRYDGAGEFQYEWYYWKNVPARIWFEYEGQLCFGTPDGRVCRFKNTGLTKYNDNGSEIDAYWTSPFIDMGDYSIYKTLRYTTIRLAPYTRTSADVYLRAEGQWELLETLRGGMGMLSFSDISFKEFTFISDPSSFIEIIKSKLKKVKATQYRVRNNVLDEGFGIYGINVEYKEKGRIK